MDWSTITVAAISAVFAGGGAATLITVLARRKLTSAEASEKLTDSAIQLLEAAKRDARADITDLRSELTETRRELADARREAREAGRQMSLLREDATAIVAYLERVLGAINDPNATLERVRIIAGGGPPNGVSSRLRRDQQLG